jgi:putative phage-type endonuclease
MELEKTGIGGSRIAALAGLSPWSSPSDVWAEVFGMADRKDATADLMRGLHLGPALCRWYADMTQMHVSHIGNYEQTRQHPEHAVVQATPDGLVGRTPDAKRIKVLEVKAPHWRTADQWGEPGTDDIPEHYLPQVTWEMAATGLPAADVGALIDGELRVYTVAFNPRLFDALLHLAEAFWHDYVLTQTPPPVDGSEGARKLLLKLYPRATAPLVEAQEAHLELLREYTEIRAKAKEMETRESEIKNKIMEAIGQADGMTSPVANAYWKLRDGRPRWQEVAEDAMKDFAEEEKDKIVFEHTGAAYRHFQIYAKRGKKGEGK